MPPSPGGCRTLPAGFSLLLLLVHAALASLKRDKVYLCSRSQRLGVETNGCSKRKGQAGQKADALWYSPVKAMLAARAWLAPL